MKLKRFGFLILPFTLLTLSSCLGDDDDSDFDLDSWRAENATYITEAEAATENGVKKYEKIVPKWDPATFVLMQWHHRGNPVNKLKPLDNSTLDVKYLLTNVRGDTLDSSYALTANGDSIFRCKPNEMITGFWAATTNMEIGDSVTAVIPYTSGYGVTGSGAILPYSTLIFNIKLVNIAAYDKVPGRP